VCILGRLAQQVFRLLWKSAKHRLTSRCTEATVHTPSEFEFADIAERRIVSRTPVFDLCGLSKCASGVMPFSSFSWRGAMLGPNRVPPVSPQYWRAWKRRVGSPAGIISLDSMRSLFSRSAHSSRNLLPSSRKRDSIFQCGEHRHAHKYFLANPT
jgi:hypothetical protein